MVRLILSINIEPVMINKNIPTLTVSVSSTINSAPFLQKAERLAVKLGLSFVPPANQAFSEILLCYTEEGLKLLHYRGQRRPPQTLLYVDFIHGKQGYRLAKNRTIKQPLARAVGIKSGFRPKIFDATAGLGADGFVLASLGCKVTLSERNPIISALLADGLERAEEGKRTGPIVADNLSLLSEDSVKYLEATDDFFHTIYLDPMYPHRQSSALGKQALRVIRTIVGGDLDSTTLMKAAMSANASRIVVKRAKNAPLLSKVRPDHVVSMKSSRFDIYFPVK